jgi:hypothetical protein
MLWVLALVVVGAGAILATSSQARVRWYAWRLRSGDAGTRTRAGGALMALGRDVVGDELYAEALAEEVSTSLARVEPASRVVFIGHRNAMWEDVYHVDLPISNVSRSDWLVIERDASKWLDYKPDRHLLVALARRQGTKVHLLLSETPVDGLDLPVSEAARARLERSP